MSSNSADGQNRWFWVLVGLVALVALAVLFQPTVKEQLAPTPVTAWVAIEVGESGLANVGPVEIRVGTPFRLHAVLEARDRKDQPVYYTQAKALSFFGESVATETLRMWDRLPVKVRWFTIEGERPYVEVDGKDGILGFEMRELARSEWPLTWSIPGDINAANDDHLSISRVLPRQEFGLLRYHVRVELYDREDQLIPRQVVRSWGLKDLKAEWKRFPMVALTLPGPLEPASRVFGTSQLEVLPGSPAELVQQVGELADEGVVFTRLSVLRDQIRGAGRTLESLRWSSIDLSGNTPFGSVEDPTPGNPAPGDLLRAGDRVVVLYEDRGQIGAVDYGDLCFDFARGAAVRALDEVFSGEGQDLQWASLGPLEP